MNDFKKVILLMFDDEINKEIKDTMDFRKINKVLFIGDLEKIRVSCLNIFLLYTLLALSSGL